MPPTYDRRMLLAVDIGNTNLTLGIVEDGALESVRRAATTRASTADELEVLLRDLLALDDHALHGVSAMAVASVVPAATATLTEVAAAAGHPRPPRLVGHRADRDPRRSPGPRRARTGSSTRSPPRGSTARRPSSSTAAPPRRSTASAPTGRSSAGRSPPGSSSGSRRSPRGPRSCRGSSCAPRTGSSPGTPSARSRPGR